MPLTNQYHALGEDFSEEISPTPAPDPKLLLWNSELATELGIEACLAADSDAGSSQADLKSTRSQLTEIFSGNANLPGSIPIALAYAGHQFGNFVPQLGDGRAHLLGEVEDRAGKIFDLQLKGSGRSRFSRRGDGRCALGPAIREYIMSEAMFALGVPTSRSLAVTATGETVYRETEQPGAVVTRVARSHLRVGTFEYFAARKNNDALSRLCTFAVERHGPTTDKTGAALAIQLLENVIEKQVELVTQWMRVGFIHGVMNTDNTSISGETIDYGPCAMMSAYDPKTVFSSIDAHGRYAFGNQSSIMQWNMARFAECLIPLIHEDQDEAIEIATDIIRKIGAQFATSWQSMMAQKLGFEWQDKTDTDLINDLLKSMLNSKLDYTTTFHQLSQLVNEEDPKAQKLCGLETEWLQTWRNRIRQDGGAPNSGYDLMRQMNPVVIPRNHHVETALADVARSMDGESIEDFLQVLKSPYLEIDKTKNFQDPPADGDTYYKTFCGT